MNESSLNRSSSSRNGLFSISVYLLTILLRIVLYPVKVLSCFLFPSKELDGLSSSTSDKAAVAFVEFFESFDSQTGTSSTRRQTTSDSNNVEPFFSSKNYKKCITEAFQNNRFLFVYLHSPLNTHSNALLKMLKKETSEGLTASTLLSDCIKWGGDIHTAIACKVSKDLNVSAFPFVALLMCKSTTSVEVIWRLDTLPTPLFANASEPTVAEFCAKVGSAIASYSPILRQEEGRRRHREEEVQLREEQDREFQQTLLEDQRREAERQEQEERQRLEALNAQRESELVIERQQSVLEDARNKLKPEPNLDTPGIARFRIMFPSGHRVERRFNMEDKVEVIRAFLTVYMHEKNIEIPNFELETNYPKKRLDDASLTIEEHGLGKMAMLMLVNLDN